MHSTPASLADLTLCQAAELLRNKQVSPLELTRACLSRIEKLNSRLNAFITVCAESAIQQAEQAEREIVGGNWRGPLHGVPLSLKDVIDTAGIKTTAGSQLFADRIPERDAEVVSRLKSSGAVIVGKTNLHEFAYGGSGLISHYGPVRNPWDTARIAGGSSSGSAVAVATGMCFASIGTDTAGSIRLPAACCGVVGLKPTFGLISAAGVIPLSWSYDHVGPITRTAADAALMFEVMAAMGVADACSVESSKTASAGDRPPASRLRVGVPHAYFFDNLDPDVSRCIMDALELVRTLGPQLRQISMPVDEDRTVAAAEAYAYHQHLAGDGALYYPETLRRIASGERITAAEYIWKRRELDQLRSEAGGLFEEVDLIITPTCPILPPKIADLQNDLSQLRPTELLMLRNTRPFNVLGLPTISIPCGFDSHGLPVGLQITGAPRTEDLVLRLASEYEATGWRTDARVWPEAPRYGSTAASCTHLIRAHRC